MKRLAFAALLLAPGPAFAQAIVVATCGSGAFTVGQLHQLTMNPAGYLCVSTTTLMSTDVQQTPKPPAPPPEPKK